MDFILGFLTLFFAVLGIATAIRYIVWKITDLGQNNYHYLVVLDNNNAELVLRSVLERNNFDLKSKNRLIYAIDFGLDEQTVSACKIITDMFPQIIFCKPQEFESIIKN